jgi:hypothetical protein
MKDIAGPLCNPIAFEYLMNVPPSRPIVNFLFDIVKPIYQCPGLKVLDALSLRRQRIKISDEPLQKWLIGPGIGRDCARRGHP